MFYTPILLHSSAKVTENYHRILMHQHPNLFTFKAEFSCPCQFINLHPFKMKYFIRIIRILHDNIYWSSCNHIKLHNTWLQFTYRICMKEDLLDSILYVSVSVTTQIQRFLLNESCTIWLFIKGFLPSLAGTGVFLFKALFKEQKE